MPQQYKIKHLIDENLVKKIKKHLYGKAQSIMVTFPAGFGKIALEECKSIINHLWFKQKFSSEFFLLKNEIRINNIHLFAVIELLLRNQSLTDIRLIISEGKTVGKPAFEKHCRNIPWHFYFDKQMSLKLKVDSVASKAFHETGLKEILRGILVDHHAQIVSGEHTDETTILHANLYKDHLTLSISLAGNPLYKRGYRGILPVSAPLREDAAHCCIQTALDWVKQYHQNFIANTVMIPFSGTGTFAFEYLISSLTISPVLFDRDYAIQKMPLFRSEHFQFIRKKAIEHCQLQNHQNHIACIDNSAQAIAALNENLSIFKARMKKNNLIFTLDLLSSVCENFFTMQFQPPFGNIFLMMNPPYGVRLGRQANAVANYIKIAKKINELSIVTKNTDQHVLGFILCPNEDTWSVFCAHLIYDKIDTYHFTQGGLDIRVCQFYI